MATLFSDNFNRANADSLGANWTEHFGDIDIASNQARAVADGDDGGGIFIAQAATTTTAHAAVANMKVSGTFVYVPASAEGGYVAICGRVVSATSFYLLNYDDGGGLDLLKKTAAGTYTALQGYATVPVDGDVFMIECEGTTIRGRINGTLLTPTATDGDITAAGQAGIQGHGDGTSIDMIVDNFLVEDFAAPFLMRPNPPQGQAVPRASYW